MGYIEKRPYSIQPFVFGKVAETLVSIRLLQQEPTLPVTVTSSSVRYIDIYVLFVQVLVALFCTVVHSRDTIFEVGIGTDVESHFLFPCHKDVVYADVVIDMETVGVQGKVAYIGFQKATAEMRGRLFLQSLESVTDMLPRTNFRVAFVCHRIFGYIYHPESVACAVPDHDMFENLSRLVDAVIHRIRFVGQTPFIRPTMMIITMMNAHGPIAAAM